MNIIRPRGVYQLLLTPCIALSFVNPINATTDYDFLSVHASQTTIFKREDLPALAFSNIHSRKYVKMYTATGKVHTAAMLGRGLYYFPIYERHLSAQHMPLELKYLSMVESELRTDVSSPCGAAGLWQFMPLTARHFGLKIESWRDERRDPEASTAAAVLYLKELYAEFGDWELALGAYNCGSGRMHNAMHRARSSNFSEVRKHLPAQTQQYLAKFYAAAYISQYFQEYQIAPKVPDALNGGTTRVEVPEIHSFQELSRICRLSVGKIKRLNPQYLQGSWPQGIKGLWMVLPEEPARRYLAHFNRIPQHIDVLPEDVLSAPDEDFLPITEPYRLINSLLSNIGAQAPDSDSSQATRRYYSKYFLREQAHRSSVAFRPLLLSNGNEMKLQS